MFSLTLLHTINYAIMICSIMSMTSTFYLRKNSQKKGHKSMRFGVVLRILRQFAEKDFKILIYAFDLFFSFATM